MAKTKRPYDPNRIRHVKKPFEKRRKSGKEEIEEYTRANQMATEEKKKRTIAKTMYKRKSRVVLRQQQRKKEKKADRHREHIKKYIAKYSGACAEQGKNFVKPFCRKKPVGRRR